MSEQLASYQEVGAFYDKFWNDLDQKKLSGINSRHRFILRNLKQEGLKRDSKVLEIGRGFGALTQFIAGCIPNGKILGADISAQTVGAAKHRWQKKYRNIDFVVSDMTAFSYPEKFDFIVFPDVLEHIPQEAHDNIFKTIRGLVHEESVILINIPEPRMLEYFHKFHRDELQIIDQPLHTNIFIQPMYAHGFYLKSMISYPVFFEEPDYQSFVFRVNTPLKNIRQKSKASVLFRSIKLRLSKALY